MTNLVTSTTIKETLAQQQKESLIRTVTNHISNIDSIIKEKEQQKKDFVEPIDKDVKRVTEIRAEILLAVDAGKSEDEIRALSKDVWEIRRAMWASPQK